MNTMNLIQKIKSIIYGMNLFVIGGVKGMVRTYRDLLLLTLYGDALGIPSGAVYYSARLFPHVFHEIEHWRKNMVMGFNEFDPILDRLYCSGCISRGRVLEIIKQS